MLTQERVKELFDYNPETGDLIRKIRVSSNTEVGDIVSCKDKGYIKVWIDGVRYQAHRVVWFWMTGEWPKSEIDHENHIKDDNRWKNLKPATRRENSKNHKLRIDNTSGICGVYWHKQSGKWAAYIKVNGERKYLGTFDDIEDAVAARKKAEIKYNFHPNHGRAVTH